MSTAVSIYIPFYKGFAYLKEAVESVLAQTNPHWTLTVMDDCGPEGAPAKEWVESLSDSRISYYRHADNKGMVANWNACVDHAASRFAASIETVPQPKLVTLLHDDDRLLPNYVDLMIAEYHALPSAALYFCGAEIIDNQGQSVFSVPDTIKKYIAPRASSFVLQGQSAFESLFSGCFIMCPTVCYNLTVLGTRRFALGFKQVQDLEFYARLLDDGLTLKGTNQIAYAYRRHASNATSIQTATLLRFEEEVSLYSTWAERLARRGFMQAASVARKKRIIILNLLYCILRDLMGFYFAPATAKIRFLITRILFSRSTLKGKGSQR